MGGLGKLCFKKIQELETMILTAAAGASLWTLSALWQGEHPLKGATLGAITAVALRTLLYQTGLGAALGGLLGYRIASGYTSAATPFYQTVALCLLGIGVGAALGQLGGAALNERITSFLGPFSGFYKQ